MKRTMMRMPTGLPTGLRVFPVDLRPVRRQSPCSWSLRATRVGAQMKQDVDDVESDFYSILGVVSAQVQPDVLSYYCARWMSLVCLAM